MRVFVLVCIQQLNLNMGGQLSIMHRNSSQNSNGYRIVYFLLSVTSYCFFLSSQRLRERLKTAKMACFYAEKSPSFFPADPFLIKTRLHFFTLQTKQTSNMCTGPVSIIWHILFWATGVGYVIGDVLAIQKGSNDCENVGKGTNYVSWLKGFPMLIMIVILFPYRGKTPIFKVIIALVFGAIGDYLLEYAGDTTPGFAAGAGSFFIGHIFYVLAMMDLWNWRDAKLLQVRQFWVLLLPAIPLVLSMINIFETITDQARDDRGDIIYAMPVYLTILCYLVIHASLLLLGENCPSLQGFFLLIGACSFFVSDNVLGKNKFGEKDTCFLAFGTQVGQAITIMATYYAAQYFIGVSFLMHARDRVAEDEKEDHPPGTNEQINPYRR